MALSKIPAVTQVGSRITLLAALLAGGSGACVGTARASAGAEVEAPAPGLVVAGPDIWVVGEADAPDAYFVDGYYWQYDGEYWYRRPRPEVTWVIVETRVVPERIVIHEHQHHSAIVARYPGRAWRREQQAERRTDAAEQRQQTAEERARDAERDAKAVQREQGDRSAEKAAEQKEKRAAREAQIAEHRERGAEHRDESAEHREGGAKHRDESAERQETAAQLRSRLAAERQAEQQRKQHEGQKRHDEKKH